MDLDIEMDVDDVQDVPQIPEAYTHDIITGEEQEPGEVEDEPINDIQNDAQSDNTLMPTKVHIRGLDSMNDKEVKAYLAEHYGDSQFERVEWIDDSSANYLFRSESAAQEALIALAAVPIADATQLPILEEIPAKPFSSKPEAMLRIRFAVASDKKVQGAAHRSRFYLLNPEYDPEERRRRGEFGRGKYRDRNDGRRDGRRDGPRRSRREESEEPEPFDVNLYGDDPTALANRTSLRRSRPRRGSMSSTSDMSDRRRSHTWPDNREKELFPDRRPTTRDRSRNFRNHRSRSPRNRSASPTRERDRDGDARMDEDADEYARESAAQRDREKGRSIRERTSRNNSTRELFPSKAASSKTKELFPTKVASSGGGKAQMDQVADTLLSSAKLAERITPRATATASTGSAFNIRGMANKRGADQGMSIKGIGATVKELFPDRFNPNSGKELFAEKLKGRGQKRQKAEDMFS